jgi:two-component system NtrC family sensor kinase
VLLNLLQNALQAMPDGGTLTVATRRRLHRGSLPVMEVAVSDSGHGIDADGLQKLFVPFYTTKSDGTGLGLPISQRIVHAHGGDLDVVSQRGRGSTFTIRLPLPVETDG